MMRVSQEDREQGEMTDRSGEPPEQKGQLGPLQDGLPPLPMSHLDRVVENTRWLQEHGLLRPQVNRPPLFRIQPTSRSDRT